jgi:hypothetical protein
VTGVGWSGKGCFGFRPPARRSGTGNAEESLENNQEFLAQDFQLLLLSQERSCERRLSIGLALVALVANSLCPGHEKRTMRSPEVQIENAG